MSSIQRVTGNSNGTIQAFRGVAVRSALEEPPHVTKSTFKDDDSKMKVFLFAKNSARSAILC